MNLSIKINHVRAEELAAHLANRATQALLDEARLTPKPGLVDRRGSGAHKDMNLAMLEASAECLTPTFRRHGTGRMGQGAGYGPASENWRHRPGRRKNHDGDNRGRQHPPRSHLVTRSAGDGFCHERRPNRH